MTREEFIKQRCEIDKITEEEFGKRYRVVKCNCGQSYCKGYRCLDLDGLLKENQKYKEVIDNIKMGISARIKKYQQKIDNEIDMGSQGDYFKICRYVYNLGIDIEEEYYKNLKKKNKINYKNYGK